MIHTAKSYAGLQEWMAVLKTREHALLERLAKSPTNYCGDEARELVLQRLQYEFQLAWVEREISIGLGITN